MRPNRSPQDLPLRRPTGRIRGRGRPRIELEAAILAELFSVERLEQQARTLAAAQTVTRDPRRGRLVLPRVAENGRVLLDTYRTLARAIKDERQITPAAEWLVDNFHICQRTPRRARCQSCCPSLSAQVDRQQHLTRASGVDIVNDAGGQHEQRSSGHGMRRRRRDDLEDTGDGLDDDQPIGGVVR